MEFVSSLEVGNQIQVFKKDQEGDLISLETFDRNWKLHGPSTLFLKEGRIVTFFQRGKKFSMISYDSSGNRQGIMLYE
jgi:hypothetical protein